MKLCNLLLQNLRSVDMSILDILVSNFLYIGKLETLECFFRKVDLGDVCRCLCRMRKCMQLEAVEYVFRGIVGNTSLREHSEREDSAKALCDIALKFIADRSDILKIVSLKLLSHGLFSKKFILVDDDSPESEFDKDSRKNSFLVEVHTCNVTPLLMSRNDNVLVAFLEMLKMAGVPKSLNENIFKLLTERARLDAVGVLCLDLIDLDIAEKDDLDRLFNMFYIDPCAFLETLLKLKRRGYELENEMVTELVFLLAKTFNTKRYLIEKILAGCVRASHVDTILDAMTIDNFYSQLILVSILESITFSISMKMFLRLCLVIPTNRKLAPRIIRLIENKGGDWEILSKWMAEKLDKLMVWIYPLKMKDKEYYSQVCKRVAERDPETYMAVCEYHSICKNADPSLHCVPSDVASDFSC